MKTFFICFIASLSFSSFAQEDFIPGIKENFFIGGTQVQHGSIDSEPYFDNEYDRAGFHGTGRYSFYFTEKMKLPLLTINHYGEMTTEAESKRAENFFETYNLVSNINSNENIRVEYEGEIKSNSKIECKGSTPVITGETKFSLSNIEFVYGSYIITGEENQKILINDPPHDPIEITVNEVIKNISGNKATVIRNAIHMKYTDENDNEANFYINHSKIEAFCQH